MRERFRRLKNAGGGMCKSSRESPNSNRLLLDRQKGWAGWIGWLLCYNLAASITNRWASDACKDWKQLLLQENRRWDVRESSPSKVTP